MEEKVIAFYNDIASGFDQEQDEFGFIRAPEREIVLNTLKKVAKANHSVLEIGAGTGRFTLEIAPMVRKVTAIDISPKMLEHMAAKTVQQGISNIEQICGNFIDQTFNEKYHLIISFSAIEYICNKESLFAKLADLLAPGGELIITTAHDTFFRWWGRVGNYFRQGIYMQAYSKKKMRQLIASNSMEIVEITDLCLKSFFVKGVLLFVHAKKI
jgi:ubiquinone/menaquinone biosynthesis C-methylase UbiE